MDFEVIKKHFFIIFLYYKCNYIILDYIMLYLHYGLIKVHFILQTTKMSVQRYPREIHPVQIGRNYPLVHVIRLDHVDRVAVRHIALAVNTHQH